MKGQTLSDNRIPVENLAVSRTDDKLFIAMDLDVSVLTLKSDQEMIFTPLLTNGKDSLNLPPVWIAGRNRYYHHVRNTPATVSMQLYRSGTRKTIEYHTLIPYEKWIGTATLSANYETCGCCDEPLRNDTYALTTLALEKKEPKVFQPAFIYIRPKAKQKINQIEGSAYIDFPVNRIEIHENYRRNPEELKKILATIDHVKNDSDAQITGIRIKGYASPEGTYANNVRLAKGRTQTLKEFVRKQYTFPDSLFSTDSEPEDWEGLERFVTASDLPNKEGILRLIQSDLAPDVKEQKIKSTYRNDYAYLLREVYPGLRHSDYAVQYEVRAYSDLEEIKALLKTQPQKLSLNEMYLAAQDMEPGSDEYNATFETAVRMFPQDEVANLNAANTAMRLHQLKQAGVYLDKAGNTPEAVYARGIYAALSDDYETARRYFNEAKDKGIDGTEKMLLQIEECIAYQNENQK